MTVRDLRKESSSEGDKLTWRCPSCGIDHFYPWESRHSLPGEGFRCECGQQYQPYLSEIKDWEAQQGL